MYEERLKVFLMKESERHYIRRKRRKSSEISSGGDENVYESLYTQSLEDLTRKTETQGR